MWNHSLWQIFQYLFVDCDTVDSGRWHLLDSSPAVGSWTNPTNIVDNSWFAFECFMGQRQWQGKFQSTNVATLDEAPASTFLLVGSLSPGGGWTAKGAANGGFSASVLPAGAHLVLGGGNPGTGSDGTIIIHGDRDTLLIAIAPNTTSDYDAGCYMGRFDPFVDEIANPECLLVAGAANNGFDRSANGVFSEAPSESFVLDATTPTPAAVTGQVYTSGWLDSAHQPDPFTGQWHYRPLELAIPTSPMGFLKHTWGAAGLSSKSRMDYRRKLVLHSGDNDYGVTIKHNGTLPP